MEKYNLEDLQKRGYDNLTYEEKQYLCEHATIDENKTDIQDTVLHVASLQEYNKTIGGITLEEFQKRYKS